MVCHTDGLHTPGKTISHTGGLYFRQGIFIVLEKGDPGPHSPGNMGNRVPILPGEWRLKVPILGGPHFHMTLAGRIGPLVHPTGKMRPKNIDLGDKLHIGAN